MSRLSLVKSLASAKHLVKSLAKAKTWSSLLQMPKFGEVSLQVQNLVKSLANAKTLTSAKA